MNKDYRQGAEYFDQSREIGEGIGSNWIIANAISDQGYASGLQEDYAGAYRLLIRSAHMFLMQNEQADLALTLERLALASMRLERWEQTVWILSAVQMWRRLRDEPTGPMLNDAVNTGLAKCKILLGGGTLRVQLEKRSGIFP